MYLLFIYAQDKQICMMAKKNQRSSLKLEMGLDFSRVFSLMGEFGDAAPRMNALLKMGKGEWDFLVDGPLKCDLDIQISGGTFR